MLEILIKTIGVYIITMLLILLGKWCGNYDVIIICILVNMFVYIIWRDLKNES